MKVSLLWTIFLTFTSSNCAENQEDELMKYLQPNDVEDSYEFATDRYNCTRKCVKGDHRICYYQFTAENYVTLNDACYNCTNGKPCSQCITADGYKRGALTVNRRLPGPSIQVCQGDRVIVDVFNKMSGRSFTIHWHGIFQKGTNHYDGVPMVTQCPIHENNKFRYNFLVRQPGTFFWHSHNGIQKVDGLQGSLIVRRPPGEDPNEHLYDEDLPAHVMTVLDWFHMNSDDHFPGIVGPDPQLYATYFLIKGRGRYTDTDTNITSTTPLTEFLVTRGKRYRFRVIGATCDNCLFRLSIQGHPLTLIATDGNAVKPVQVNYAEISSGERYDFVLNANATGGAYWIEVRAQGGPCELFNKLQLAKLIYEGSNSTELTVVQEGTDFNYPGVDLNPYNATCNGNGICAAQLEAIEDFDPRVMRKPDINFPMYLGYYFPSLEEEYQSNTYDTVIRPAQSTRPLSLWINNVSYSEAPSPLISQRHDIPKGTLCPVDKHGYPRCSNGDHCYCTSVFKVPLNALVQVIIVDRSIGPGINHPIHLHGFAFNVMAMGYLKDLPENEKSIEELMKTNNLTMSRTPVLKDTVTVPGQGYTVIRFIADNPGYWFFHCHFIYHHVGGMAMVLQVGDSDKYPRIPATFPKCGNSLPTVKLNFDY